MHGNRLIIKNVMFTQCFINAQQNHKPFVAIVIFLFVLTINAPHFYFYICVIINFIVTSKLFV